MSKVSTRYCNTFGDIKAGRLGPKYMPFIPSDNNANKSATAFCSYQESTIVIGSEFTSVLKASASAVAILTAE